MNWRWVVASIDPPGQPWRKTHAPGRCTAAGRQDGTVSVHLERCIEEARNAELLLLGAAGTALFTSECQAEVCIERNVGGVVRVVEARRNIDLQFIQIAYLDWVQ